MFNIKNEKFNAILLKYFFQYNVFYFSSNYLRQMAPQEVSNSNVLISPLNWGWGHVSRCIPLIQVLSENSNRVYVACNAEQEKVFRQYFPHLNYLSHDGYPFYFGLKGYFVLDVLRKIKSHRKRYLNEHFEVEEFVKKYHIDIVISDHRYGFFSQKVPSVFLTHQLNLPVKWHEWLFQFVHEKFLRSFQYIWIPDTKDSAFAGKLSTNNKNFEVSYIGLLSRFSMYEQLGEKTIDNLIVVSGPQVYAIDYLTKLFEEGVMLDATIIAPQSVLNIVGQKKGYFYQSSEDWIACDHLFLKAKKITSRSGYSTIMDIQQLSVPCSLIPTVGQREQEYLFRLHTMRD
jgi:hypothetical protein